MPSLRPRAARLVALLLIVPVCLAAQQQPAERFRDPEHITGDPTGLQYDSTVHAWPHYPDRARAENRTAAPVVAFVVDTLGRVEVETASFLDNVDREFRDAVCAALPAMRFIPLEIGGQKMRVLLVQTYAFTTWSAPDAAGQARAAALVHASQERFATQPVTAVIRELDDRPHCDTKGSQ